MNATKSCNDFSFMPETKDVLSICTSSRRLVAFFLSSLFLSKLNMRGFLGRVSSSVCLLSVLWPSICVCVCVCFLRVLSCVSVCDCVNAAVSEAESLMKFNSLTWSFSLSRPQRKRGGGEREREREREREECSVTAKRR